MNKFNLSYLCYLALILVWGSATVYAQPNYLSDADAFSEMRYRLVGPFRGGRVTAVTGIPNQMHTFFMGSTGGGVWKTQDGGTSWKNISDGYIKVGSIGSIEVSLSDPNVIYVGTGSASPRGNVSPGKGMYKSVDGGKSWRLVGLEKTGHIGKIQIHPTNPDWVYAAALGNVFGANTERGIYRSMNGGRSWEKVCFVSDTTGAIDLVMDPNNPRVLYAGFWRAERKPWTLIDGGAEGGVYKSTDGGDTWDKLGGGLPEGVAGRVGLAVSPANSQRVWMIRETQEESEGGIYRSEDGGKSWRHINREHNLRQRAWYYSRIFADPQDENTVYVLNTGFYKSVDGGKNFRRIATPHGDNHCLWINPYHPEVMVQSNDGGANVSYNGGRSWSTQLNQPTAELYRLTVDNQFPYRLYGAQQDNTTISIPSNSPGGLTPKQHWYDVGGGESGHIAVDPRNPNIVYAGNYIGLIDRTDLARGHTRNIVAYPQMHDGVAPRDIKYRFQWNAPIRLSPHNPDILYHASQYVHRSMDSGQTWEVISPDLTTNKDAYQDLPGYPVQHDHTGVELYTTIFALEESPHQAGELWAGTDDGRVHISKDDGKNWEEITPREMPLEGTVNTIELSTHAPGRAFMAVYKYRDNDFRPYIFMTTDYGKSWRLLTDGKNGIPTDHFVRVVREDPDRKGLLYAGTEFGMYLSWDEGKSWQSFQLNLPYTPITDMQVFRKDLVVATQGRSFWILDDLSPLHQISERKPKALQLLPPREAYLTQMRGFRGVDAPSAAPSGAIVYFYLNDAYKDPVKLEIRDSQDRLVKTYSSVPDLSADETLLEAQDGLNRMVWDLKYTAPDLVGDAVMSLAYTGGPTAAPGTYTLKLIQGDHVQTQSLALKKDPRWEASEEDLQQQFALSIQVLDRLVQVHRGIKQIRAVRTQLNSLVDRATGAGYEAEVEVQAQAIIEKLNALEEELIQTRNESGQDPINYPPKLDNQIAYLYSTVNSQDALPTQGCYDRLADLEKEMEAPMNQLQAILDKDLADFDAYLEKADIPRIILPRP